LESLWRWHICNIHCRWKRKSSFNHKYECIKNIDALGWLALFYWSSNHVVIMMNEKEELVGNKRIVSLNML
jgi:hypothetical protein